MRRGPVFTSVVIHVGAVMLLLLLASIPVVRDTVARLPDRVVPLLAPRLASQVKAQSGGGQRNPLPASRGKTPPRAVAKIFVPPMAVRIENPKLAVQQSMVDAPDLAVNTSDIGDPLGELGPLSGGPGGPFGIGGGTGPGIGNGRGQGSTPSYKSIGITQEPKLLHAEEPEYSDEARRARLQGTVVLAIDVDVNGGVANVRVVRSLGLGLDERAIAAVMKWKFRPAMAGGRPVTAPAQALVTFHLL